MVMTKDEKLKMYERNQQKLINALVKKNKEFKELQEKHEVSLCLILYQNQLLNEEQRKAARIMADAMHKNIFAELDEGEAE